MMNYKAIEKLLTGETEKESKVIRPEVFKDQTAYNTVMNNCQRIGGKRFCCIPLELLEIDEDYQRVYCINMEKVYSLVRKWDFNKCEPILVSPHPETATFAVIDGSHRMLAAGIREEKYVIAVLTEGLPVDPMERKMKEAALFSEQGDDVDKLSLAQKHRANVTMGVKKYCVLDNCLKGRKLLLSVHELKNLPKEKRDALKAADYKVLTGYAAARDAAALTNGEETLNNIFDIIEKAGWHTEPNGYAANVICPVKSVLNMHDNDPRVVNAIIGIFEPIKPNTFFADALSKYHGRRPAEYLTMHLEKEVAKKLGIQPLYTGGDLRKVTSVINSQRHYKATGTENK